MKRIFTLYFPALFCLISQAQEELHERVYVHTDKMCYLTGEEAWIKLYTTDTHFQPSFFNKVGYVEISNAGRPQAQLKLAFDNDSGSEEIRIPADAPSGIYELSGYTQYTRNEEEKIFFRKQIAMISTFRIAESDPTILVDSTEIYSKEVPAMNGSIRINTSRPSYSVRQPVELTINGLPEEVSDLIASISRDDSLVIFPHYEKSVWRQQVTGTPGTFSGQWVPGYEGHIIRGQIQTPEGETLKQIQNKHVSADIVFVGKDIRYVQGRVDVERNVRFYISNIFGINDIVAAAQGANGESY